LHVAISSIIGWFFEFVTSLKATQNASKVTNVIHSLKTICTALCTKLPSHLSGNLCTKHLVSFKLQASIDIKCTNSTIDDGKQAAFHYVQNHGKLNGKPNKGWF